MVDVVAMSVRLASARSLAEYASNQDILYFWPSMEETASLAAFLKPHASDLPLLSSIVFYDYEPEGEFVADAAKQEGLLLEIGDLRADLMEQQKSSRAEDTIRRYREDTKRVNPMYASHVRSSADALRGLDRLEEFVRDAAKKGRILVGETD